MAAMVSFIVQMENLRNPFKLRNNRNVQGNRLELVNADEIFVAEWAVNAGSFRAPAPAPGR